MKLGEREKSPIIPNKLTGKLWLLRNNAPYSPLSCLANTDPRWIIYPLLTADFNSPPPSATYMHQWTGSTFIQIMACRLFGADTLSKQMLGFCQLDSWERNSESFESELYHFYWRKYSSKCHLPNWRPFCLEGVELLCIAQPHLDSTDCR